MILIIFVSFAALHSGFVSAGTFKQVTLSEGRSAEIAGKTILLEAAYSNLVLVSVDGEKKTIKPYAAQDEGGFVVYTSKVIYVNGINVTVVDVMEEQGRAILNLSTAFDCGDGTCESGESQKSCCEDCGCSSGYSCVDNQCIETSLNECFSDAGCNDNNNCSTDSCAGLPRKCSYVVIDYCNDNDNCCPENCTYDNDYDCPRETANYECFTYRDCKQEEQNPCNMSSCVNGSCFYEITKGCVLNETCMPLESIAVIDGENNTCTQQGWAGYTGKKAVQEGKESEKIPLVVWFSVIAALLVAVTFFLVYKFLMLRKKVL